MRLRWDLKHLSTVLGAVLGVNGGGVKPQRREERREGGVGLLLALLVVSVLCLGATNAPTRLTPDAIKSIRFEQKLDQVVSLETTFVDETGKTVKLGNYFGKKPVILVLGYYECPMLCGLVHNGLIESLSQIKLTAGENFSVVSVSIDPKEKPALAAAKKAGYVKKYDRPGAESGWHFLTGTGESIKTLANEVGFEYARDPATDQFAHPSGIVILTPKGKTARYFFGISYAPAQMETALRDANRNRIGIRVQEFLFLCFHYNPANSQYGNTILLGIRICGVAIMAGLAGVIWWSQRSAGAQKVPVGSNSEKIAQATKEETR